MENMANMADCETQKSSQNTWKESMRTLRRHKDTQTETISVNNGPT